MAGETAGGAGRDPASLLPEVVRIAQAAGRAILEVYEAGFEAERKADGSPVTAADRAAEAVILPALATLAPEIVAVSEEAVDAGRVPDIASGRFWLVDPLDGTREFVSRNGEFTVNIALLEDFVPVLGVIHAPVRRETYAAAGAGSAVMADRSGATTPISARPVPDGPLIAVASRSHRSEDLEAFLGTLAVAEERRAGSALKFCLVAAGKADCYPRPGPTMEWDTAAGHAILLAAGGRMTAWDGSPFVYGKPGFRNPGFVVWGARAPSDA